MRWDPSRKFSIPPNWIQRAVRGSEFQKRLPLSDETVVDPQCLNNLLKHAHDLQIAQGFIATLGNFPHDSAKRPDDHEEQRTMSSGEAPERISY